MRKINFPLKRGMQGPEVGDLQDAMLLLLERGALLASDEGARQELSKALRSERREQIYGEVTAELVSIFQDEHGLEVQGEVDEKTADAINALLEELGVLDTQPQDNSYIVSGQVCSEDGTPQEGLRVLAAHETGSRSIRLGEDITDVEGRYTIRYERVPGVEGLHLRVAVFSGEGKLLVQSDLIRQAKPLEIVDLVVPLKSRTYSVSGKVYNPVSAGLAGLRVVIVDKGVVGDLQLAETTTTDVGAYQAVFSEHSFTQRGKLQPDLQARVFSEETLLGESDIHYNAPQQVVLNILLDSKTAATLRSEYDVLTGALSQHYKGRLGDLRETPEQQDITYLANKSGWDARAVALAALADQFSARTADAEGSAAIDPALFYALFRAGLPANEDTLYQTEARVLEEAWTKAAQQGVIPADTAEQIPTYVERFQEVSAQKLLSAPAVVGVSSLQEMLTVSHLDSAQQETFARIYTQNRADTQTFWQSVSSSLGKDVAQRLQVNGKLAFLTLNNATLMETIHTTAGDAGLSDPLQLAQMGFYRSEPWKDVLGTNTPVPKEIPGGTLEAKQENYTRYLAAQVRLSYPTAAVAHMVKSRDLPLNGSGEGIPDQVHAFLTQHQGKFEIGMQPVQQYVAHNQLQVPEETLVQIKRLQRVYQITPNDQALIGLMKNGMDSAYKVAQFDKASFVERFAQELGGEEQAVLTYERSAQVHNTVLNIALSYINAQTAPPLGVHSPPSIVDPVPAHTSDVIAYTTLESLFGSMDFCDCEHCRSILSPAAYLVDLLLFLDQPDPPEGTENPQTVLLERRPDIAHLPLTCDNTNTALPYIDVVNETLEYYIANTVQALSLEGYQGHDTNTVASEDLLASPQYVMDAAYDTLRGERFPLLLPFHQPLENLRQNFLKLEVPLPLAMEHLRKTDDLERGANPYGWRDILMEEIHLSRGEYEILTDSVEVPLWQMYGFPDGTPDAAVIAGITNAKIYSRRLDLKYEDLVAILKTRFINPNSILIPKLERLGVSFATLKALKDGTLSDNDFDALLAGLAVPPDPAEYGGDPTAPKDDFTPIRDWVKDNDNFNRIMGLITLTIPAEIWAPNLPYTEGDIVRPTAATAESSLYFVCTTPGSSGAAEPVWPTLPGNTVNDGSVTWTCRDAASSSSFNDMAFRYSDPAKINDNLSAVEFVRLLRFIRIWKKLGWTIEQTDAAVCALYRADLTPLQPEDLDSIAELDAGFSTLLPRLGVISQVMRALKLKPDRDLLPLLVCWSEIGTHGSAVLYRQMFLNPVVYQIDKAFAGNGYGEFLTDGAEKLADHAETLRSAFNLSGAEYQRLFTTLNYDINTNLSLANISALFRRGWLARKLKLSLSEFLLLVEQTGLDPFTALGPPSPDILRLVELVHALKERSLKPGAALYLVWNQDLSGRSAPKPEQITELGRTLRADFAAIDDQFSGSGDPNEDPARVRMILVYGQETSDTFFALLDDTIVVDVAYTHSAAALEAAILAASPKIAYDPFRHRLSHTGLLTPALQSALKGVPGVSQDFKDAVDVLFARGEAVKGLFFTRYPELKDAFDLAAAEAPADRHTTFLAAFQPELARRRKRQQAMQRISASAGVDLLFTQTILEDESGSHPLHAASDPSRPALDDVLALETPGLAAQFFFRDTATGTVDQTVSAVSLLSYSSTGSQPFPNPGNAISGIWSGQIEAPEAGYYNLVIEADPDATVTFTLAGQVVPMTQNGKVWRNTGSLELKAGNLYEVEMKVEKVKDLLLVVWETPNLAGEVIPARYLYPPAIFTPFSEAYTRFLKAASLALGLSLSARELAHFATDADYQIGGDGWLNLLPVTGSSPNPNKLLAPLLALMEFTRIKAEISPGSESLITALGDPLAATQDADSLLFTITRWTPAGLDDVLDHFGITRADLVHFDSFRRVYDALALVQQMGISAKALIQGATNDPDGGTVRDLQAALRARYDAASWRDVIKPVNDELRALQRDALVAYILHQMVSHPSNAHINTPEKLFEYFLMDLQMEPCMLTSRIRHALSSVQLFTERCLMNLEQRVSPAAINAQQWTWMKRYRVWEANRKVYLYPENWLEPELRDDKSPFFKELESELLQSDITEDSAAVALLNYLSKLEDIARLEPCGIHYVPADPAKRTGEINHVVARTPGANRKYYYRRYEYGYWTPWEGIKLDIEDNPVIPVVWDDRLFLFWLRIMKQGQETAPKPFSVDGNLNTLNTSNINTVPPKITIKAMLCWSEYFNGKWQPTRTSDAAAPLKLDETDAAAFDRSKVKLSVLYWTNGGLRVIVSYDDGQGSSFFLSNPHSSPSLREPKKESHFPPKRTLETAGSQFKVHYSETDVTNLVLKNATDHHGIQPTHPFEGDPWDAPFFFEDPNHVFYVTTEDEQVFIKEFDWFGYEAPLGKAVIEIPPLVQEPEKIVPDVIGPIIKQPGFGVVDPSPVERFVTEDVYIHQALGTTGTIHYGDVEIGLAGSQVKSIRTR